MAECAGRKRFCQLRIEYGPELDSLVNHRGWRKLYRGRGSYYGLDNYAILGKTIVPAFLGSCRSKRSIRTMDAC